jgi:hypothetical protein
MREMCYLDAIDYIAEEILKEYTIEDKEQIAYDSIYNHLEANFTTLMAKAEEHGIIITKD